MSLRFFATAMAASLLGYVAGYRSGRVAALRATLAEIDRLTPMFIAARRRKHGPLAHPEHPSARVN